MGVLGVGSIQHTGRFKSERGRGRMGGGEGVKKRKKEHNFNNHRITIIFIPIYLLLFNI